MKTDKTVERRTRRLLEGYHLAEDSARYADVEAALSGLRPSTGHYGCSMMVIEYMPFQLHDNYEELCNYLGKVAPIIKEKDTTNIFVTGDVHDAVNSPLEAELLWVTLLVWLSQIMRLFWSN